MDAHKVRISVLIPAYNSEETLKRAIVSAQDQSHPPDEIIVSSDGSTDRTVEIARRLGCVAIENPKANGAAARNAAFARSSGDFIFLLDSDDEWLPEKIEHHLEFHSKSNPTFVIDPSRRIRPDGSPRGLNGAGPEESLDWNAMVEHRNWSCGSAISVRRDAWEKIGGFNPKLRALQDVDFLVRLAHGAGPGVRCPIELTRYHLSASGISRGTNWGDEIIEAFAASCSFLSPESVDSVRKTIALRNAMLAGPSGFWQHIKWGRVSLTDPRVAKLYLLVLSNALKLRRL